VCRRTDIHPLLHPRIESGASSPPRRGGGNRWGCALLSLIVGGIWQSAIPVYAGHGEEPVQTISMERVKLLLDNKEKIFFVDLRTPKEFQQKRLPGARSIPVAELEKRLTEIPKTGRVILYCTCRPGDDSYAYFLLRDNEYNNVSVIDDGFDGWVKRKFPVETGK
jgi:rhodanese-related sulfurtransferase